MSKKFNNANHFDEITLPPQDLRTLSFCGSTKVAKVEEWISNLRSTQVTQTGIHLYQAIPQVLRLKTDPVTRFDILEAMRQSIQYAVIGLAKQFLSHNLASPEYAQKTAIIALALQKNLIDGYTICVKELIGQRKLKGNQLDILSTAIHRAISSISWLLLRHYQIYTQVSKDIWPHLYALYETAEHYELLEKPVRDPIHLSEAPTRIMDTFVKVLIFSSSRLNQVSPNDVFTLFKTLDKWVRFVPLRKQLSPSPENKFLVNLSQGKPPCQTSRFDGSETDAILELDCNNLATQLSKLSEGPSESVGSGNRVSLPKDFPSPLLCHVLDSWMTPSHRNSERRSAKLTVEICTGIIDCHTEICGGFDFEDFMLEDNHNVDDELEGFEGIESLLPGLTASPKTPKADQERIYKAGIQNISKDGYCLMWKGEPATHIEAGELIALREQQRRTWNLGIARWIRKTKHGSQIGVQLLSTQPQPYAACAMTDTGEYSQYMRAFYLPAPRDGQHAATLVTASVPFKPFAQVRIKQDEQEIIAKLKEAVISTSKISQFEFNTLKDDEE